jgi:hypothetical protein
VLSVLLFGGFHCCHVTYVTTTRVATGVRLHVCCVICKCLRLYACCGLAEWKK